jgi:GTP pyrophosphokinase
MVAVTHSVSQSSSTQTAAQLLCEGVSAEDARRVADALDWAQTLYGDRCLGTHEPIWQHALGMSLIAASLRLDADSRIAALRWGTCW